VTYADRVPIPIQIVENPFPIRKPAKKDSARNTIAHSPTSAAVGNESQRCLIYRKKSNLLFYSSSYCMPLPRANQEEESKLT
jgi:hypothetical protein